MFRRKHLLLAGMSILSALQVALAQTQGGNGPAAKTSGQSTARTPQAPAIDASTTGSLKAKLHASDEEWTLIEPKLRNVIAARQAVETGINTGISATFGMAGGFGGGRGRGGRGGGGPGGFGNDSFNGPSDGAGGFGPGGGGFGGFGPGGFGPGGDDTGGFGPGGGGQGRGGRGGFGRGGGGFGGFGPGGADFGGGPGGFGPGSGGPDGFVQPNGGTATQAGTPLQPKTSASNSPEKKPASAQAATAPAATPPARSGAAAVPSPATVSQPPFAMGFGGGFPGVGGAQDSAISQAMTDLQQATSDTATTSQQLHAKVAAVRAARQKAKVKLESARKELLELVSPEQEAVLVGLGYLE